MNLKDLVCIASLSSPVVTKVSGALSHLTASPCAVIIVVIKQLLV